MDSRSRYDICLEGAKAQGHTYHWTLSDDFFQLLDEQEIEHGDLNATLRVTERAGCFDLDFSIEGEVEVPCDRCLSPMRLRVATQDTLTAKLGQAYADDGETIVVPAETKTLNVAWNMYELIALAVPIHHVHDDDQCELQMQQLLSTHAADGIAEHDSRWDALKQLLDSGTSDDNK